MFNNAMMKKAKQMQEKMKEAQEEISRLETEGSSGGVTVKMIAGKNIQEVSVSENVFDQKDKALLEKFIKEAVNDAADKADNFKKNEESYRWNENTRAVLINDF